MKTEFYTRERDEVLVQQYASTVYKLAFAQTRNSSDADDVFQEVFLRYVDKCPEFESKEHEKAWFIRVTLNCCKDLWRSPFRQRSVPLDESLPFETTEELHLHRELLKLPKKYRAVLHLFYYEDLPTTQIARILQIKPAAVRQQLARGRTLLKDVLGKEIYDA